MAVMPCEARDFAFMMARKDWGEIVESVCRALHGTGKTVRMIMEKTELPFQDVRNSLVVLMAHNIVTYKAQRCMRKCSSLVTAAPIVAGGGV